MKKLDLVYVGIQVALFTLFLIVADGQLIVPVWLQYIGMFFVICGVVITAIAIVQLNKFISPFPSPRSGSLLITNGLFSIVRHPIYLGILMFCIGYSIYQESIYKFIVTLMLFLLFYFKSEYEERMLCENFPTYAEYRKKTWKMIPYIL